MPKLSYALVPITAMCWLYSVFYLYPLARHSLKYSQESRDDHTDFSQLLTPPRLHTGAAPYPSDTPDNIFYFAQISDLHVSQFKRGHLDNLRMFFERHLPRLNPEVVVVTGDLTDAKEQYRWGSHQFEKEWKAYNSILIEFGMLDNRPGFYWDQRGNHDCFSVAGWGSLENYFSQYSKTKTDKYAFTVKKSFGTYSFIGIDACPVYGPGRPFNFFGYFDTFDMNHLQKQLQLAHSSNHTFIMSHYPISTTMTGMASDGSRFSDLARHFSVFLCGHLHKLAGGIGDILHAQHPEKFLELELADMKQNGHYRIVAIDHDLISFTDSRVDSDAPVIVLTNPKDTHYIISKHEPWDRIRKSSHIRWLSFAQSDIVTTQVFIDNQQLDVDIKFIGKSATEMPLYAAAWNPSTYNDNERHTLKVVVIDDQGRVGSRTHVFRVDGRRTALQIGVGGYIMSARMFTGIRFLFVALYVSIMVFLLLIPKLVSFYLHRYRKYHRWRVSCCRLLIELDRPKMITLPRSNLMCTRIKLHMQSIYLDCKFFVHASKFRLVTLASLPRTFYPLYFYGLYIVCGPIFIGELIPSVKRHDNQSWFDSLGAFYLFGVHVEHQWIPMVDTWLFGLFELTYIFGPLVVYLSFSITPPEQLYAPRPSQNPGAGQIYFPQRHDRRRFPIHRRVYARLMVAMAGLYQLFGVFFIGFSYGPWAAILSPGKTWFVMWAAYALFKHRWSARGREIDILTEKDLKRMYSDHDTLPRSPVMVPSKSGGLAFTDDDLTLQPSGEYVRVKSPLLGPSKAMDMTPIDDLVMLEPPTLALSESGMVHRILPNSTGDSLGVKNDQTK